MKQCTKSISDACRNSFPLDNQTERPSGLSRLQIHRALRLWTVEGSVATVQMSLTTGAFQTGFALFLGCSAFWIGALAAIPAFAGLIQLFSSYVVQRYGNRKILALWCGFISRAFWLPMLLIPFLLRPSLWVAAFLLLTLLSALFSNVSAPLWTAWITDLVPEDNRGRYFGQRNMYAGWVAMLVPILGGYFLDRTTKSHLLSDPSAFAAIFGFAFLFALGSFFLGSRSPDVPQENLKRDAQQAGGMWSYYSAPFRDHNFQRLMFYLIVMVAAQTVAAQFFLVYQLQYLKLNYTSLNLLTAVASLTSLAAMPLWGYLADKYGNKPILVICGVLIILPPILWALTVPDGIPGLWQWDQSGALHLSYTKLDIILLNTIAGVGWAGVNLTQFNLMIGSSPSGQRTVYVSAVAAVAGLVGGIAPLAGGALLDALAHVTFPRNGLIHNNYHVLFILSAVLRGAAVLMVGSIHESGSRKAGYVLKQLKSSSPIGSFTSIQKLSRGSSAQSRVEAAVELTRLKPPLAVEELVRALDDVARPVREQAAIALGEIRDPRATMPLVRKLTDPASGITSAAATALGKIGDPAALPSLAAAAQLGPPSRQLAAMEALGHLPDPKVSDILMSLLGDHDPAVRTSAVRALAEREDLRSLPGLVAQLEREQEPAILATLADALGRLGDPSAAYPLIAALSRTDSPTVRREMLNAIGSIAGGRDAFYPYLALDSYARDETVGKILGGIARRYRIRAAQKKQMRLARLSLNAKHALEAYTEENSARCIQKLACIGHLLLADSKSSGLPWTALEVLFAFESRSLNSAEQSTPEEALLAVFLIRQIAAG